MEDQFDCNNKHVLLTEINEKYCNLGSFSSRENNIKNVCLFSISVFPQNTLIEMTLNVPSVSENEYEILFA